MKYDNEPWAVDESVVKVYAINYFRMLFAAFTAGLSSTLASLLFGFGVVVEYVTGATGWHNFAHSFLFWVGVFLIYRVWAFMANRSLELTPENVQFMSEQRILWNVATIAVVTPFLIVRWLIISHS